MADQRLFPLQCALQTYPWGKTGRASLVAQLAPRAAGGGFTLDEHEHYAELWMGTHPNGPARLAGRPTALHTLVSASPAAHLGQPGARLPHSTHLPFLFKILSMARALPLQAHPDKALAAQLHARDAAEFVDDNHKPEMALAVADGFRGFVGFRPLAHIAAWAADVPELREAIGDDGAVDAFVGSPSRDGVRRLFAALLARPQDSITPIVQRLVARVREQGARVFGAADAENALLAEVVGKAQAQYPGDVGVLAGAFFLNLVTLNKGEAVYIGADEIHAYLEGDIIECMAVSDNVVNAAFVPPAERDVRTFTAMLTYSARPAAAYALPRQAYARSATGQTTRYAPPLEEFAVLWTRFDAAGEEELGAAAGPAIAICVGGSVELAAKGGGEKVRMDKGSVVYVRSGTAVVLESTGEADVYWAVCDA